MSDNNNDYHKFVNQVRTELDKTGPGFCLAKWYHVSMHLHIGYNHSCYHPHVHKIPLAELAENVNALHNTKWKKIQRKLMLEGQRPPECSYCWDLEDLPDNNISDRPLRSSEQWAWPRLEEARNTPWDADVYPSYLELNFSNNCQFKCSYCAPMASITLFKETEKFGDWPLEHPDNKGQYSIGSFQEPGSIYNDEDVNPYIEAFWKWFPNAYPHLNVLRFTGGEPLLSANVFKVMDYIKDNPNKELEFAINSNMGIPHRNLEKFVTRVDEFIRNKDIKRVSLFTSVDTWGPQAEWIRNGLDLDQYEKNIDYYMQNVKNASFSFMITFCLLSIPNFNLLLDKILELRNKYNDPSGNFNRVMFDTPYMLEPPHLTALIADDKIVERLAEHLAYMKTLVDDSDINKFDTTEYLKLERVYEWITNNRYTGEQLSIHRRDFAKFVDEHDHRRNTDWHRAFPKLEYFYNICSNS